MSKKTSINNLVLLSTGQSWPEGMRQWAQESGLATIHCCSNKLVYGPESSFTEKPIPSSIDASPVTVLSGKNAYSGLLNVVTGLHSKNRGDSMIVQQFKEGWNEFASNHPKQAHELSNIYSSILADNGLIRSHLTSDLRPAYYETVAARMADLKDGSNIMLVLDNYDNGKPVEPSMHLLKRLGSGNLNLGTVLITHPRDSVLKGAEPYIQNQLNKYNLCDRLQFMPFKEAIGEEILDKRAIFINYKMGKSNRVDRNLMFSCQQKEVYGGRIVHLGGAEKEDRQTEGLWKNHQLETLITPEDITGVQEEYQKRNNIIIKSGKRASQACATIRSEDNRKPNRHDISGIKYRMENNLSDITPYRFLTQLEM